MIIRDMTVAGCRPVIPGPCSIMGRTQIACHLLQATSLSGHAQLQLQAVCLSRPAKRRIHLLVCLVCLLRLHHLS